MNERITSQAQAEVIAQAIALLPGRLPERLGHVAFFTADPIAAGLHDSETHGPTGLRYREVAHVCYGSMPWHFVRPACDRRTTIVLPLVGSPGVVLHELGHALHEVIGFEHTPAVEVTEYARLDSHESFAEAFVAWSLPQTRRSYGCWDFEEMRLGREDLLNNDPETVRLFEALAHG
jgi:hypothetical protein